MENAFAQQRSWHIAINDTLRQAFYDGGFSHAGFADERGVVFVAPRQDLDDAFDFHFTANDGIQFFLFGQGGEINGQLVDHWGFGRTRLASSPAALRSCRPSTRRAALLQYAAGLAPNLLGGNAQFAQHIEGNALAVAHEAEQQMLGADVMVAQATGFFEGKFEYLLGAGREVNLAAFMLAGAGESLDNLFHAGRLETQLAQNTGGHAAFFANQTEQQVLGANVIVAQALCFVVGKAEHAACSLS